VFHTGASLSGSLDGQGGTNTLDYAAYTGDLVVDLPLGTATAVAGGIQNIGNVTGSIGNDLIVGDANANVLVGGTGRNVLIGGAGADQLFGGSGDNILLSGTTSYDSNLTALLAILSEWTRTDRSFHQRLNDLTTGGGLNGSYVLNADPTLGPVTAFDDAAPDVLTGGFGSGLNWFFSRNGSDTINNRKPGDHVTRL
jgi:Ca2+-binding RTX toxin-like protein